jgi:replicative DNA helicase
MFMVSNQRLPPQNLEAEASVLGAFLLDRDAALQVADFLHPEHFYAPNHRDVYEAMLELYEAREPIDLITLTNQLRKNKTLTRVGGGTFLTELANKVPTAANVKHYATIVKNLAIKREMIGLSGVLAEKAFDEGTEADSLLETAEQGIFQLSHTNTRGDFISMKDVLVESFDRLELLHQNQSGIRGIPSGFADIDNMLSGFQPSNLIILAARPGMGKTALALNVAQNAAVLFKKRVAFFSLEMSKEELVDRLLVSQADIDAWRLKTGRLGEDEFTKLSHAMGILAEAAIYIDDTPGLSISEIRTKARRLMLEQNIELFVVDYLQLVHGYNKENRVLEVGEISQGLKNLARELKVPVLALAQLSRAVESRGTKEPQLSDLRESGSIEQDADVVAFLYRQDDDVREQMKFKIAKHRNGNVGTIDLFFRGDRIRFYGMETTAAGKV